MNDLNRILYAVLLMCALLISSCASAEIACECGKVDCICFIQLGDRGIAVDRIIDLLAQRGYLSTNRIGAYDGRVRDAVRMFQRDHSLDESGMMNDDTLTFLIWGNRLSAPDLHEVWVPTDGGKKHHSNPTCSNMNDPRKMSLSNAQKLEIVACKRCNK